MKKSSLLVAGSAISLALFSATPAVLAQPVETSDNSLASQSPKHILLDQELELVLQVRHPQLDFLSHHLLRIDLMV